MGSTQPIPFIEKAFIALACSRIDVDTIGVSYDSAIYTRKASTHTKIIAAETSAAARIDGPVRIGNVATVNGADSKSGIPVVSPFAPTHIHVYITVLATPVTQFRGTIPPIARIAVAVSQVIVAAVAVFDAGAVGERDGSACLPTPRIVGEALTSSGVKVVTCTVCVVSAVDITQSLTLLPGVVGGTVTCTRVDVGTVTSNDRRTVQLANRGSVVPIERAATRAVS